MLSDVKKFLSRIIEIPIKLGKTLHVKGLVTTAENVNVGGNVIVTGGLETKYGGAKIGSELTSAELKLGKAVPDCIGEVWASKADVVPDATKYSGLVLGSGSTVGENMFIITTPGSAETYVGALLATGNDFRVYHTTADIARIKSDIGTLWTKSGVRPGPVAALPAAGADYNACILSSPGIAQRLYFCDQYKSGAWKWMLVPTYGTGKTVTICKFCSPLVTQDHNAPISTISATPVTVDWSYVQPGLLLSETKPLWAVRLWRVVAQFCSDTAGSRVRCQLYNYTDGVVVTELETTSTYKSNHVFSDLLDIATDKVYCIRIYRVDPPAACYIAKAWLEEVWLVE